MSEQRRNFLTKITTTAGAAVAGYFSANPATASNAVNARGPNGEASVLDFMSAEARADARSGAPSLDHSAAIQAAFSSGAAVVNVPGGYVFKLTKPLKIEKTIRVMGGGELRFTAGIANAAAITVTAQGCEFDGVYLTNPNMLQSNSGARNVAIMFRASLGSVTRSTIRYFQNGIQVESTGEYHDFIIANNRVIDCIGAGGGPTQKSTYGEDRGDGITVWGCAATITGNLVTAKAGQDCRIGIHMEGLANYHADSFPLQDNMCTVVGNVVRGPFRTKHRHGKRQQLDHHRQHLRRRKVVGHRYRPIAGVLGHRQHGDIRPRRNGRHRVRMGPDSRRHCRVWRSGAMRDIGQYHRSHARSREGRNRLLGSDVDDAVAVEQRAATNGTARVTLASANPAVQLGQLITGPGVPSATFVVSVAGTALLAKRIR